MADLAEDSGSLGAQLRSAGLLEYQLNGLCPTWEWSRHGTLGGMNGGNGRNLLLTWTIVNRQTF